MPGVRRVVSYFVAPDGRVVRRVVSDLGSRQVVTSEVPIAPDLEAFKESHPNQSVTGEAVTRPQEKPRTKQEMVAGLSDEELAELGLQRVEGGDDGVEATQSYPIELGSGWYELSDGSKVRGEDEALEAQAALDEE